MRFRPLAWGPQGPCWARAPPACTGPGQRPHEGLSPPSVLRLQLTPQVHRAGTWLGAAQRSSENQHSGGDAGGVAEAVRQRPVSHVAEQVEEVQTVTLHPEGPGP